MKMNSIGSEIKVLMLCTSETRFVIQLWTQLKRFHKNIRFSLLTMESSRQYYANKLLLEAGESIYAFGGSGRKIHFELMRILGGLPQFDIIHSLWMEDLWGIHAWQIKSKCKYWVSSVGGSDLFRYSATTRQKLFKKRILNQAAYNTYETDGTGEYFFKTYGDKYKKKSHVVCPFGVDVLDEFTDDMDDNLLKHKWKLPVDKVIVVCGHNASKAHCHTDMLDAISHIHPDIRDNLFLLIPMTYPDGMDEYIKQVRKKVEEFTENYLILTDYLNNKEMAEIAYVSDVMIHVQTTDQLSSTMLSHMYCGNVVIAGSWLPYNSLEENGIKFKKVDKIDELGIALSDVYDNLQELKSEYVENKQNVFKLASWENASRRWYRVYETLMGGKSNGYSF